MTTLKYKVGDMVRLGSIEEIERCIHGVNDEMRSLAWCVATISMAYGDGYRIDLDNENWFWCDNCISHEYFGEPTVTLNADDLL